MTSWQRIQDLPTPALLLDWPVAHRNIKAMARLVERTEARLRPHFKSHKCLAIAHEQLAAGNCVGMTAATVDEAWALVEGGIEDVLVANQIVVSYQVCRLVRLAKRATIRVSVASQQNAAKIAREAQRQGTRIGVLVEIEIGHLRWGVAPGKDALSLAKQVAETPGLRFDGLQAYHGGGGHICDDAERAAYARQTMNLAIETRRLIEASGLPCPIVSGTGTSTFRAVVDLAGLTELQVGSYVLMDWAFKERTGDLFEIALTVLATVIATSSDQFVLDVGMKGLGNRGGAPRFPDLDDYEVLQYNAEEHTIVRLPRHGLRVGDQVRIMPSHANGTLNLYRQVVAHEGETIRHIWPITATGYAVPAGNVG